MTVKWVRYQCEQPRNIAEWAKPCACGCIAIKTVGLSEKRRQDSNLRETDMQSAT